MSVLSKINLTSEHIEAVNRERRIIIQDGIGCAYFNKTDSYTPKDLKKVIDLRLSMVDEEPNQIDSVWWCLGEGNVAVKVDLSEFKKKSKGRITVAGGINSSITLLERRARNGKG